MELAKFFADSFIVFFIRTGRVIFLLIKWLFTLLLKKSPILKSYISLLKLFNTTLSLGPSPGSIDRLLTLVLNTLAKARLIKSLGKFSI